MKWLRRLFKLGLILALLGALAGGGALLAAYFYITPKLPDIEELRKVQLQVPLKVYSHENELIAEFGEKRRSPLDYAQFPETLVNAVVSAEDANFFTHPGVDIRGLARAAVMLVLTGERRQGGSTITMQVARNFYLTRKKTYLRKLYEIFLALQIEKELSKGEILELYLNKIYLGHRSYGVGAASQVYYGKTLDQLSLAETAMIAGLPKAPSAYNPLANPPRAVTRRNYVLGRMRELGYIDQSQYQEATDAPVTAKRYAPDIQVEAPYVAEMVRAEMVERFGQEAYTGGFRVYTTIRGENQAVANRALRRALDNYSDRHGYRGPETRLELPEGQEQRDSLLAGYGQVGELRPALVTTVQEKSAGLYLGEGETIELTWQGMQWARKYIDTNKRGPEPKQAGDILAPGDLVRIRQADNDKGETYWRLAQVPKVSGALISMRAKDGAMQALVGGYDYYSSKFNRVTQAQRQPGSGFKAFIYSAALEHGYTPASIINDAPVVFDDPSLEGAWRPENYSGKFFGPTRLRYALKKSRNLVSIRVVRDIGVEFTIKHAANFGFDPDKLPHNLSLALGSANVTPLDMSRAYSVLANGGFLIEPYVITRIEQNGDTVYQAEPVVACPECDELTTAAPSLGDRASDDSTAKAEDGTSQPRLAPRVLGEQNRFLMYSMMQDVIRSGTAVRARKLGRRDIAGKTGTTNDQRDAWFNGYNQSLVTNVWVGFDNNDKLGRGEVGGRAALPAWIEYMQAALKGTEDIGPSIPEDIISVRIDPKTGLAAAGGTEGAIFEYFRKGNVPEQAAAPVVELITPEAPTGVVTPEEPAGAVDLF